MEAARKGRLFFCLAPGTGRRPAGLFQAAATYIRRLIDHEPDQ